MIFWLCWTVNIDCLQIWLTRECQNKGAASKYISISFYFEEENKNDLLTNQTQKASEKVLLYTRAICSQLNILEQSKSIHYRNFPDLSMTSKILLISMIFPGQKNTNSLIFFQVSLTVGTFILTVARFPFKIWIKKTHSERSRDQNVCHLSV